jgi:hypothetical protein
MAFQKDQWPDFEERANSQLASPKSPTAARLWRYPWFEAFYSWQFSQDCVWEEVWDRPYDWLMVADPLEGVRRSHRAEPTIQIRSFAPGEEILSILDSLGKLQAPLVGRSKWITLDGVSCGLTLPGGFSLRWNQGTAPEEWAPIVEWTDRLVAAVTKNLAGP